jgi:hypothetical protein
MSVAGQYRTNGSMSLGGALEADNIRSLQQTPRQQSMSLGDG